MAKLQLGKDETLVFDTVLSQAQVSKFNGLAKNLILVGATPYVRLDELHGVLLTNSRKAAKAMVMNHMDLVKPYLVRDPVMFKPFKVGSAIRPMGIYLLLEHLAEVNPKKGIQYKASLALMALILSNHPQLLLATINAGTALNQQITAVMNKLKQQHNICQMTGLKFHKTNEKHVHHIECASLNPHLAAEPDNLVVIHEWVHDEYHHWASDNNLPVCRSTLGLYAVKKRYSTPFVQSLKAC